MPNGAACMVDAECTADKACMADAECMADKACMVDAECMAVTEIKDMEVDSIVATAGWEDHLVLDARESSMTVRMHDLHDVYHLMNINFVGNIRPPSDLWKAVGFTVAGSLCAFVVASQYDYIRAKCRLDELSLSPAIGITVVCGGVFVMWQSPDNVPYMTQYFASSYASSQKSLCWPLLLSVFSHKDVKHLVHNLGTLFAFTPVAVDKLGIGQFTALFIAGGLVSMLVSLVHKCVEASPIPSLGASGAIMAVCSYTYVKMPQARLRMGIFEVSAEQAMYCTILYDLAGFLLKFPNVDHVAHLGGFAFGWFYAKYGEKWYSKFQSHVFKLLDVLKVNLIVEHLVMTKVGGTLG
ncbi:rhomboid family domain-containing protein [Ditylenchus destructor]|nr:rhomboid family domain-containing protein [Ditylenchus destructor]